MGNKNLKQQIILGLILVAVIALVFFLTFQGPRETISLSEMVRAWAIRLGYNGDPLKFRSDFHIVEYFVVGIASAIFAKGMNWRAWIPGIFASTIGLLDETIKIFLPTREFSGIDLLKDFCTVWAAILVVSLISNLMKRKVVE